MLLVSGFFVACAEETAPGPITRTPEDVSTPQPEAAGTTAIEDFQGQALPFPYFLVLSGRENGGQALLQRGIGRVELNEDLTEAKVTIEEGVEPIQVFRPEPSGNFFDPPGSDFGDADAWAGSFFLGSVTAAQVFLTTNETDVYGILGFTTPMRSIPANAAFNYISDSPVIPDLLLVREGSERAEGFSPVDLDAMSVTVDFGTGNVEGRLFRNRAFVDESVALTVTLENGRIEDGVVRGGVRLAATFGPNDREGAETLPLTVTYSNVIGQFYGETAQSLGVVYAGEGTVEVENETVPFIFGGVSLADR